MKRVLITGATGFIGKALIKYLIQSDIEVLAVVLPQEKDKLIQSAKITPIVGDLNNSTELKEILKEEKFDTIYHLAWIGVSTQLKNSFELQVKNLYFANTVMELASEHDCKRVICPGSVSEYAYIDDEVNGMQVPCPSDVYSSIKVSVHLYCDLYARQHGIGFSWTLIPSIYGPGRVDNNLITYTIQALLRKERPKYTKLEQQWDYIYIDDLIKALYLIGEKGKGNTVYPIGYGKARKMSEYVTIIKNIINKEAEIGIGELQYKTNRIDNAIVDIQQLQVDTGFEPQITFEEGIEKTIEFFKELEIKNV